MKIEFKGLDKKPNFNLSDLTKIFFMKNVDRSQIWPIMLGMCELRFRTIMFLLNLS